MITNFRRKIMNYTDFLIQKLERKDARYLAREYKYAQILLKSKNIGENTIGKNIISAVNYILELKDMLFQKNFKNYMRIWNE